jgi:beta-glucosidase
MTLEEKIGQMCQYVAIEHIKQTKERFKGKVGKSDDQYGMYPGLSIQNLKDMVKKGEIGSFLHVKDVKEANELQKLAMQSRLKVPLIIGIDAIHGQAHIYGATVYPTQLSLSSTWDDDLLYQIAKETAKEVRATGMHWTFSPNVEVARDPRW